MKNLEKLLIFIFCISLCFACSEHDDILGDIPVLKKGINSANGLDQDRYVVMKNYDNFKVHYRIIGKGPIDMVLIPGWTNPLTVYNKQFDYFRDKARCIYIDLPGTGLSDAQTPNNPLDPDSEGLAYTQELMIDAIRAVVKKEGLHKFIGVGFSWSGTTLKRFEMKYPGMIKQLILLDISIPTWSSTSQAYREGQWAFWSSRTPEQLLAMLPLFINSATAPPDLWEFGMQNWPNFPSWLLANMRYHVLAEENCQPYPWDIPILVVYNEMDEVKEALTNLHYTGCEIHLLNCEEHIAPYQHVIQWAYYEEVNQLMDDSIDDRPGKKY